MTGGGTMLVEEVTVQNDKKSAPPRDEVMQMSHA